MDDEPTEFLISILGFMSGIIYVFIGYHLSKYIITHILIYFGLVTIISGLHVKLMSGVLGVGFTVFMVGVTAFIITHVDIPIKWIRKSFG